MPSWLASRGEAKCTGVPSNRSSPLVGRSTPARIFTSVDLPAPFSPISACTRPCSTTKVDAGQRRRRREALAHASRGKNRRHGGSHFLAASTSSSWTGTRSIAPSSRNGAFPAAPDEGDGPALERVGWQRSDHGPQGVVVQRVCRAGIVELVREVRELDEARGIAQRGAAHHRPDLNRHGHRRRTGRLHAHHTRARLTVDRHDHARALEKTRLRRRCSRFHRDPGHVGGRLRRFAHQPGPGRRRERAGVERLGRRALERADGPGPEDRDQRDRHCNPERCLYASHVSRASHLRDSPATLAAMGASRS